MTENVFILFSVTTWQDNVFNDSMCWSVLHCHNKMLKAKEMNFIWLPFLCQGHDIPTVLF